MADLIFRTTGAWGAGKGGNLTPAEVDGNFYELEERIAAIAGVTPDQIDTITASGTQLTITLTDARAFTVTLPVAEPFSRVAAVATATKTLAIADGWSFLRCTASGGCEVTVPTDAQVNFVIGTEVKLWQAGAGAVTLNDQFADVTLNAPTEADFPLATRGQYSVITLKKVAADTWDVFGDLAGTGGGGGSFADTLFTYASSSGLTFSVNPADYETRFVKIQNDGAFFLSGTGSFNGSANAAMFFLIENVTGAGTLTFSNFVTVTGDTMTTTVGDLFLIRTTIFEGFVSHAEVVALV